MAEAEAKLAAATTAAKARRIEETEAERVGETEAVHCLSSFAAIGMKLEPAQQRGHRLPCLPSRKIFFGIWNVWTISTSNQADQRQLAGQAE